VAGEGVLLAHLDDRLLHRQRSSENVEVPRLERDQLVPPKPRLDKGLDHQPVPARLRLDRSEVVRDEPLDRDEESQRAESPDF